MLIRLLRPAIYLCALVRSRCEYTNDARLLYRTNLRNGTAGNFLNVGIDARVQIVFHDRYLA